MSGGREGKSLSLEKFVTTRIDGGLEGGCVVVGNVGSVSEFGVVDVMFLKGRATRLADGCRYSKGEVDVRPSGV